MIIPPTKLTSSMPRYPKLLKNTKIAFKSITKQYQQLTKKNVFEGKMLALVSINEKPAGMISFGDQIRPGIASMMQRLHNLNVKQTVMLTGDSFENAQKIAQQIGITYSESDLLPEQKLMSVKRLK